MTPSRVERFETLDAWRGLCALVVALEHLQIGALHGNLFVQRGYRFVDFFFVLSGFVIAHAYRERLQQGGREIWRFMLRRIGRLWPLHATILAVLVLFELGVLVGGQVGISIGRGAFEDRNTLATLPLNLILVHAWGMLDQLTWNTPSWSISAELFAYGAFAAVCIVARRAIPIAAAAILVGSAVVVVVVAPEGMKSVYDFALLRCLFGFMTGVLIRSLHGRLRLRIGTIGEVVVLLMVIAGVTWLPVDGWIALAVTPLFALAVWTFAAEDGALSRLLRHRWPQSLGAWSYSIYMVHATIMFAMLTFFAVASKSHFGRVNGVASIVGPTWLMVLVTFVYLVLVVGVSWLTYRNVELRGQRAFNRWASK